MTFFIMKTSHCQSVISRSRPALMKMNNPCNLRTIVIIIALVFSDHPPPHERNATHSAQM